MSQPITGQPISGPIIIQAAPQGQSGWDKGLAASASCGKFVGLSGGVVCAIIVVVLCAVGIFFYRKKNTAIYNQVSAVVTSANCAQEVHSNGKSTSITYNCALKVKYTVNNVQYENSLVTDTGSTHNVNETMTIYYNTQDPNDIKASYITNQSLGEILIGIGSLCLIFLIIHVVLTMKSEWYNRLQCLGAVSNTVSSAFRY